MILNFNLKFHYHIFRITIRILIFEKKIKIKIISNFYIFKSFKNL